MTRTAVIADAKVVVCYCCIAAAAINFVFVSDNNDLPASVAAGV